jgi:processive 1,2-diacylglycerol beta-glucosyltransferase
MSHYPEHPMNPPEIRCLVLSSLTGGGHQSAATAIAKAFEVVHLDNVPVIVHIENVLEQSTLINKFYSKLYNAFLRHWQQGMFLYYHYINFFNLHKNPFLIWSMRYYAQTLIETHRPTCIVSVHPMMQEFAHSLQQRIERKTGVRIPIYTIVTDPCHGFWKGWAHPEVNAYFTATEGANLQLREMGIDSTRMACMGLPVSQRYRVSTPRERQAMRLAIWGDRHTRLCLFFNGGLAGNASNERMFLEFCQHPLAQEINLIVQTGKNTRQANRLRELQKQYPALRFIVATHEHDMQPLYTISDLMITKPGALTVFEALHQGIPLLIDMQTAPMPQERGTARYLEAIDAGLPVANARHLIQVLESLFAEPERLKRMSHQALNHANHGASVRIATHILNQLEATENPVAAEVTHFEALTHLPVLEATTLPAVL